MKGLAQHPDNDFQTHFKSEAFAAVWVTNPSRKRSLKLKLISIFGFHWINV